MTKPRASIPVPTAEIGALQQNVPFGVYSEREGINASGLKDLLKSPGHYLAMRQRPAEASEAMRKGTLLHTAILEPERFAAAQVERAHVLVPSDAEKGEPERFTRAAYDQTLAMADGVRRNQVASELLSRGQSEVSLWWRDPVHRELCKARVDFLSEAVDGAPLAIDIKSAADNGQRPFAAAAHTYRYDLQAAHYCEGGRETGLYQANRFAFVVVESRPPYHCIVYFVGEDQAGNFAHDDRFLNEGSQWREYAMRLYAKCKREQAWPFPEAARLQLPGWSLGPQDLIDRKELEDV